jgi:hypothetical protein
MGEVNRCSSVLGEVRWGKILMLFACWPVQEEKAKQPAAAEKKADGGGGEEKKQGAAPPPPPPPPEEVVMRVFMHCEGCARKVKKILKGFDGNAAPPLCLLHSLFLCSAIVPLCSFLEQHSPFFKKRAQPFF